MKNEITLQETFYAMIKYLQKYREMMDSTDIETLLNSMKILPVGGTNNLTIWNNWIKCLEEAIKEMIHYPIEHIKNLKEIIEQDPNNSKVLTEIGALECIFHHNEDSINYLRKAINADPRNVDSYFWLATCLITKFCKFEEALALIEKALELDENRADCLSLFAKISINNNENKEKAIYYIKKAIDIKPYWFNLRLNLISLLVQSARKDLAKKEAEKALFFIENIEEPKDVIQKYFERMITGRSIKNKERYLKNYFS